RDVADRGLQARIHEGGALGQRGYNGAAPGLGAHSAADGTNLQPATTALHLCRAQDIHQFNAATTGPGANPALAFGDNNSSATGLQIHDLAVADAQVPATG